MVCTGHRPALLRQYAPFAPAACRHVARSGRRLDRTPSRPKSSTSATTAAASPVAKARAARSPSSAAPCRAKWWWPNPPPAAAISTRRAPGGAASLAEAGAAALPALRRLRRLRAAAPGRARADRGQAARADGQPAPHRSRHAGDRAAGAGWPELGLSPQGPFLGAPGREEGQDPGRFSRTGPAFRRRSLGLLHRDPADRREGHRVGGTGRTRWTASAISRRSSSLPATMRSC